MSSLLPEPSPVTHTEVAALHARVIALENAVVALLATQAAASARVQELAANISPQPGHTQHALTRQAAARMRQLLERAAHIKAQP